MTATIILLSAAATALNAVLFIATGNLVSLGCAIFCACCFVMNLVLAR